MTLKDPYLDEKRKRYPNHKQWTTGVANDGRVFIQDDNFTFDARLYINGDFYDLESQTAYAEEIAKVLNQANEGYELCSLEEADEFAKKRNYTYGEDK